MSVDVLFSITIPVLSRHHIFMLHSRQRVGELLGFGLEDLVVGVLDLDVLFLYDGFDPFVIFEIQSFVCDRFEECD